jgi:autotransporter adhesin
MNKIYRVVWNVATASWSAVAETAKGRTKGARRVVSLSAVAAAVLAVSMGTAAATEACKTTDGRDGTLDEQGVCQVAKKQGVGASSGVSAALDDTYFKVNSTGAAASATGTDAVAIGPGATASNSNAIAIGNGATASGSATSIGIGLNARATTFHTTAVGENAEASGQSALAIGRDVKASGLNSTALGTLATASNTGAVAAGYSTNASGVAAVALGSEAQASQWGGLQSEEWPMRAAIVLWRLASHRKPTPHGPLPLARVPRY